MEIFAKFRNCISLPLEMSSSLGQNQSKTRPHQVTRFIGSLDDCSFHFNSGNICPWRCHYFSKHLRNNFTTANLLVCVILTILLLLGLTVEIILYQHTNPLAGAFHYLKHVSNLGPTGR